RLPSSADLSWLGRVRDELATLPETLKAFRQSVEDLRAVSRRLQAITEVMERTQKHLDALGVTDTARQLDDAVVAVERQLTALRGSTPKSGAAGFDDAVRQMRKTATDLSELGWRFVGGRPPGPPDTKD
ncbi:MAG: hypothetical protein P8N02_13960, partial [Actinomycetota bacterium]|nr:hypothetical protein [Actinomycetota bacterium]